MSWKTVGTHTIVSAAVEKIFLNTFFNSTWVGTVNNKNAHVAKRVFLASHYYKAKEFT